MSHVLRYSEKVKGFAHKNPQIAVKWMAICCGYRWGRNWEKGSNLCFLRGCSEIINIHLSEQTGFISLGPWLPRMQQVLSSVLELHLCVWLLATCTGRTCITSSKMNILPIEPNRSNSWTSQQIDYFLVINNIKSSTGELL